MSAIASLLLTAQLVLASSPAIGDLVASGLGIARVTNTSSLSSQTASSLSSAAVTGISSANGTVNGGCYASWLTYWSASRASVLTSAAAVDGLNLSTSAINTTTLTSTDVFPAEPQSTWTYVQTIDRTVYSMDGGFTISTEIIDTTSTNIQTYESEAASTYIYTTTITQETTFESTVSVPPKPSCTLPSVVPQCESEWTSWISTQLVPAPTPPPHCDIGAGFMNNRTVPPCAITYSEAEASWESLVGTDPEVSSPACTAASIGGALCSSIVDNYANNENAVFEPTLAQEAFFFSQGTLGFFNGVNTSWTWPTSSTLGVPSCTLGCGRCGVTGGTVQLLYWPATTTLPSNGSATAVASPRPTATGPVTAVTFGTTLTSPTFYISYGNVYASNACGPVGSTLNRTIIAIPTNEALSSVYAGTIGCDAHFRPTQEWTATASFNVTDLNSPVPSSIYTSQPWCATYQRNNDCNPFCPTTAPYKPILVVPSNILQSLDPAWATCSGDIRGVYDPPIALTGTGSVAQATVPFSTSATPTATPGSSPTTPATQTSQPSAGADNFPSSTVEANSPPPSSYSSAVEANSPPAYSYSSTVEANSPPAYSYSSTVEANSPPAYSYSSTVEANSPPAYSAPTSSSQDPGGVLASILGAKTSLSVQASQDPTATGGVANSQSQQSSDPTSTQDAGGILASILGNGASSSATKTITHPVASQPSVVAVASQGFTVVSQPAGSSGVVVANAGSTVTLPAAGAVTTLGGQVVSAASSGGAVIGTGSSAVSAGAAQASAVAAQASPTQSVVTAGDQQFTILPGSGSSSGIVIANGGSTVTLATAGASNTLGGQVVGAATSGGVVIGTGSSAVTAGVAQAPLSQSVITAGGQQYTILQGPGSSSGVVVANGGSTVTLATGAVTSLGGQVVSAAPSGGAVFGSGVSAITAEPVQASPSQSVVTVGSQQYTILPGFGSSGYVIENGGSTITLATADAVATLGGEALSVPQSGGVVVGTGSNAATVGAMQSSQAPLVTIGSQVFTVSSMSSGTDVFADGQTTFTISPGGSTFTVDGQTVQAGSSGQVIVGSSTLTLPYASLQSSEAPLVTIGSDVFTVSSLSNGADVFADGQTTFTISPGGSIVTVNGQTVRAGSSGQVVVGSSTLTLASESLSAGTTAATTGTANSAGSRSSASANSTTKSAAAWKRCPTKSLLVVVALGCIVAYL